MSIWFSPARFARADFLFFSRCAVRKKCAAKSQKCFFDCAVRSKNKSQTFFGLRSAQLVKVESSFGPPVRSVRSVRNNQHGRWNMDSFWMRIATFESWHRALSNVAIRVKN